MAIKIKVRRLKNAKKNHEEIDLEQYKHNLSESDHKHVELTQANIPEWNTGNRSLSCFNKIAWSCR